MRAGSAPANTARRAGRARVVALAELRCEPGVGAVPEDETPAPSDEAVLLSETRDLLRAQQSR